MPVLLKILLYVIGIVVILHGFFGNNSGLIEDLIEEYIPDGILYKVLTVLHRICFVVSGIAIFLLVNRYSQLSNVQIWILIGIIFNPLILLLIVVIGGSIGYAGVCVLQLIWIAIKALFMALWCEIIEPIFYNIKCLFDKIGITPKLKNGLRWLHDRLPKCKQRNLAKQNPNYEK